LWKIAHNWVFHILSYSYHVISKQPCLRVSSILMTLIRLGPDFWGL
jgi:hypothetical protein